MSVIVNWGDLNDLQCLSMDFTSNKFVSCEFINRCCAPMINQSDPPFRSLVLKYGTSCVYTEMLYSDLISKSSSYIDCRLQATDHTFIQGTEYQSRPLVVQICGNNPNTLMISARKIILTGRADAIDFNLGCPQDRARDGLFGSYLLDKCHWQRVFDCVSAMKSVTKSYGIPLFCKIRLCDGTGMTSKEYVTNEFCEGLSRAGADMICIHGRTRGTAKFRRVGPADLVTIKAVACRFFGLVPVIANGNIVSCDDVTTVLRETSPAVGVMSAEGLLADPALFGRYLEATRTPLYDNSDATESTGADRSATIPDRAALFREYCALSEAFYDVGGWEGLSIKDTVFQCELTATTDRALRAKEKQLEVARQHLSWMLEKRGHGRTVRFRHSGTYRKHTALLEAIHNSTSLHHLIDISNDCLTCVFGSLNDYTI